MRISLRLKIMAAFLFLIFISAVVISQSVSHATSDAFDQYSTSNRNAWGRRLALDLADYYTANNNSWQGIDVILAENYLDDTYRMGNGNMMGKGNRGKNDNESGMMMGGMMDDSAQRIMLTNGNNLVIFDSSGEETGKQFSMTQTDNGIPILANENRVGTLFISSGSPLAGSPAAIFIESVRHSILASVLTGAIIAIVLGGFLFNQITAPLQKLEKAAVEVGKGNFNQRVDIKSRDELADVGNTFNKMAESLEKAQDSRQRYMADIAHELRTPLTAIQGTIEAMQDNILPLDDEQLDILHSQTTLLNRLVNDLRLLSIAEAGQLKLDKTPQNPGELTTQIIESIKPLAGTKGIALETEIVDPTSVCELDRDRFTQILNNLLSNALRYTPEGGSISVKVHTVPGNRFVELLVTDSGSGIDADDLPFVFDRFYRADASRARISGGAGLGLAIVKQLVEAHGGQISVKSPVFYEPGQKGYGTQFAITLPVT
jgi:signal transduction histidine kinase